LQETHNRISAWCGLKATSEEQVAPQAERRLRTRNIDNSRHNFYRLVRSGLAEKLLFHSAHHPGLIGLINQLILQLLFLARFLLYLGIVGDRRFPIRAKKM